MGELATITVLPENGFGRPIDLQLKWNAEDQPVTIWGAEGKGYGGLSFRFAPGQGTVITTAYGRDRSDLNLARLPWADLTATFRDAPGASGVAIFVSPHHTGFPPTWITRHYGFLGVGWPGADPVILQPGETTTCNYRILIHRGSLDPSRLQQAYHEYARTH